MCIFESAEMYLETILILSEQKENVRAIDIVEYMDFSKPSVSRAVKLLKEGGYITLDDNRYITLTESGEAIGRSMYERHKLLTSFLVSLGVDEQTASNDACKIEHDISEESFEAIKNYFTGSKK